MILYGARVDFQIWDSWTDSITLKEYVVIEIRIEGFEPVLHLWERKQD